jgi:16S rRNA (cytosine967-C5)-methyltransferase
MPVSPARIAAFDILLRVDREDAYASELLHAPQPAKLSSADHALATELVMGVLRWRSLLDQRIAGISSQKLAKLDIEVLIALRVAAYQMLYLEKVPARAAIHESVELVKRARKHSAAPFVNAVLRKLSERTEKVTLEMIENAKNAADLAVLSAHPSWLVERWARELGLESAKLICINDQSVPVTAVRLRDAQAEGELRREGIELAAGRLLSSARRIVSGDITKSKAFGDGRVVIQDEASQLVALLVGRGSYLLDCCAAPGGKTAVLADRNPQATIFAAELHPHRARLLRKLVLAPNVHVLAADARSLPLAAKFDRVLVDVPCSGTGTLARNPEIKWRLKPEDIVDLQSRQYAILKSAMSRVASGGRLVYSTCSLEPEENGDVVEQAIQNDGTFRLLDCRSELERLKNEGELVLGDLDPVLDSKYLRTIPGALPVDGFFAAILEKR